MLFRDWQPTPEEIEGDKIAKQWIAEGVARVKEKYRLKEIERKKELKNKGKK